MLVEKENYKYIGTLEYKFGYERKIKKKITSENKNIFRKQKAEISSK